MTVLYHTDKVVVGAAALFLAPYVPGSPAALPADTVTFVDVTSGSASAWASPWVFVGATEQGITVNFSRTTQDINIEESPIAVAKLTTAADFNIGVSLAEDTLETMKISYGGGTITTTAAATGVPGVRELALSESLDLLTLGFEGKSPAGNWRRGYIPIVASTGSVATPYRRAAGERVYPVTLSALCPLSSIRVREWNAAAL